MSDLISSDNILLQPDGVRAQLGAFATMADDLNMRTLLLDAYLTNADLADSRGYLNGGLREGHEALQGGRRAEAELRDAIRNALAMVAAFERHDQEASIGASLPDPTIVIPIEPAESDDGGVVLGTPDITIGKGTEIPHVNWLQHSDKKSWQGKKPEWLSELIRMHEQGEWSTLVVFDGEQVILIDAEGNELGRYPATSGLYSNSLGAQQTILKKALPGLFGHLVTGHVTDTSREEEGPIPEGTYTIDWKSYDPANTVEYLWRSHFGWADPGHYSAKLIPDSSTDTKGRDGFRFHGGTRPGSAGCIDVGSNEEMIFQQLLERLKISGAPTKILVKYSS